LLDHKLKVFGGSGLPAVPDTLETPSQVLERNPPVLGPGRRPEQAEVFPMRTRAIDLAQTEFLHTVDSRPIGQPNRVPIVPSRRSRHCVAGPVSPASRDTNAALQVQGDFLWPTPQKRARQPGGNDQDQ